jgi:hypothetical protein
LAIGHLVYYLEVILKVQERGQTGPDQVLIVG